MKFLKVFPALTVVNFASCTNDEMVNSLLERAKNYDKEAKVWDVESLEISFPFLKSTCIKDALKEFLPQCLKYGIESIESARRVETAIKLSVCEFKESGLKEIPSSCEVYNPESLTICMQQLGSSNKWWTTYSGNYQRLPTICFENALPYEKEQILRLFLNITDFYKDFNHEMTHKVNNMISKLDLFSDEYIESLNAIIRKHVSKLKEDVEHERVEIKRQFMTYQKESKDLVSHNLEDIMTEIEVKDIELKQLLSHVFSMIKDVEVELTRAQFSDRIEQIRVSNLGRWEEIDQASRMAHVSFVENQESIDKELFKIVTNIKEISSEVLHEFKATQFGFLESYKDHDDMIKNYLLPTFSEHVVELEKTLLEEWKQTNNIMTDYIDLWSGKITNEFEMMMYNLNETSQKVSNLNTQMSLFEQEFMLFSNLLTPLFNLMRITLKLLYSIISSIPLWGLIGLTLICNKFCFNFHLAHEMTNYLMLLSKWGLVLVAVYLGWQFGWILIS